MADKKSRNYSGPTIKRLYALSGNSCAFPGCDVAFLNQEDDTNFSNICHIEDANRSIHKSDRYNPSMTSAQRAHYNNLILLCANHHIETNDPDKYTVAVLKEMKRQHETKVLQMMAGKNLISKNHSVLSSVVGSLGARLYDDMSAEDPFSAPNPAEKILYNNVVRYQPIIEEYRVYQGRLNKIYEEIENQGSTRKELVLRNIKIAYLQERIKYKDIEEIRANADDIIEGVREKMWNIMENSGNTNEHLPIEAVQISLYVVLVDAFMRCSILEEPPKV